MSEDFIRFGRFMAETSNVLASLLLGFSLARMSEGVGENNGICAVMGAVMLVLGFYLRYLCRREAAGSGLASGNVTVQGLSVEYNLNRVFMLLSAFGREAGVRVSGVEAEYIDSLALEMLRARYPEASQIFVSKPEEGQEEKQAETKSGAPCNVIRFSEYKKEQQ